MYQNTASVCIPPQMHASNKKKMDAEEQERKTKRKRNQQRKFTKYLRPLLLSPAPSHPILVCHPSCCVATAVPPRRPFWKTATGRTHAIRCEATAFSEGHARTFQMEQRVNVRASR